MLQTLCACGGGGSSCVDGGGMDKIVNVACETLGKQQKKPCTHTHYIRNITASGSNTMSPEHSYR